MSDAIIRVTNGEKYYNRRKPNELHVIDNLNIELPKSGLVAVYGKSGCGKTTLLNVIGGLDKLGSGKVEIFGNDLGKGTDKIRNRYIGYVFQNYNLNKAETVFENVADALRLCGMTDEKEIEARVMASLANVSMEKFRDRHPDTLSGGQQQRVAIARALVKNPPILLADEPTGNLDETNTVMVMDILKEISKNHLVLLVTHEANLVDYYSDRVIEIVDGSIQKVYDNEAANGFVARNKNHIYLGELPMREVKADGVSIEYYGEPKEEIKLQIVSVNGKIYLKTDNKSLQILDSKSEVRLKNGSFEGEMEIAAHTEKPKAMKDLSPMAEGGRYGRLYHFKNALSAAWRENFFSSFGGKKKKGKRLLRVVMVLLSVVSVFLSAAFGVSIKQYFDVKESISENVFLLPVDPSRSYTALSDSIGKNGIDIAYFVQQAEEPEKTTLTFTGGSFMTSASGSVSGNGVMLTDKQLGDATVLCGSRTLTDVGDMIVTRAMADELLKSSSFSYLDSYESLLGLVTDKSTLLYNRYLRIVGVVEGEQKCFYVHSLLAAQKAMENLGYSDYVVPASTQTEVQTPPAAGTMVAINYPIYGGYKMEYENYQVGQKISVLGREFTVSRVITRFSEESDYVKYVKETYGKDLLSLNEYVASALPDASLNDYQKALEWAFNYYPQYLNEFAKKLYEYRGYYYDVNEYTLANGSDAHTLAYIYSFEQWQPEDFEFDVGDAYEALLFYRQNGAWPTASLADEDSESDFLVAYNNAVNWDAHGIPTYQSNFNYYSMILCDEDYETLICSVGKIGDYDPFYVWDDVDPVYYYIYLMVHASEPETAASYLEENFGDFLITPKEQMQNKLASSLSTIIRSAVALFVVVGSLCLCVYFIMRSSFMSRVKEVGIQRAIGVSKGNLIFRFGVEVFLLTTLTEFIGFAVSAYVLNYLSKAVLFSSIFYFPWWMAGILLAALYVVSLFFGVLPALFLLRKTPSEILAKYDI